jgi:predicted anti-sigma-YlaC factor YlaD
MMPCKDVQDEMMDRALGIGATKQALPTVVRKHLKDCEPCRSEAAEMRSLMLAMDAWQAPEPNPYFMTRFTARLEEERTTEPLGWLARLRSNLYARFTYGKRWRLQPVTATALSLLVLVGGGVYLSRVQPLHSPEPAVITVTPAVIHDLQSLDTNTTALDTLESLSGSHD